MFWGESMETGGLCPETGLGRPERKEAVTVTRTPHQPPVGQLPSLDDYDLKAQVAEALGRWPAAGVAVGVVRGGCPAWLWGCGVADVTSGEPVTEDTVFRIGSLTKTITAVAVMQLWERDLVDLDAPANDYLRTFRLVPAKPGFRPATVRHLLTTPPASGTSGGCPTCCARWPDRVTGQDR